MATHYIMDAKPLGCADERTHVAWVGDAVQGKDEFRGGSNFALLWNLYHSEYAWRRILPAHLFHLHLADDFCFGESRIISEESFSGIESNGFEIGLEQLFRHLVSFHDEEAEFFAEFLLPE